MVWIFLNTSCNIVTKVTIPSIPFQFPSSSYHPQVILVQLSVQPIFSAAAVISTDSIPVGTGEPGKGLHDEKITDMLGSRAISVISAVVIYVLLQVKDQHYTHGERNGLKNSFPIWSILPESGLPLHTVSTWKDSSSSIAGTTSQVRVFGQNTEKASWNRFR